MAGFTGGRLGPVVPTFLRRRQIAGSLAQWWVLLAMPLAVLHAARPAVTPAPPAPPAPSATADAATWVAAFDAQMRAEYDRNIAKPYDKGLMAIRSPYLAALDRELARTTRAGLGQEAAAWREEINRISVDGTALTADEANMPSLLKVLRRKYRPQVDRLVKDRDARVRALFARCDDSLTKKQTEVQAHPEEVAVLQKEREQLRADWLPAAELAAATPSATPAPPGSPTVPAPGTPPTPAPPTATPPAAKPPASPAPAQGPNAPPAPGAPAAPVKLSARDVLAKLRALGAQVAVKPVNGQVQAIEKDTPTVSGTFTFVRVQFPAERPDQTPVTAEDYDILDSLSEVQELELSGAVVKDAIMEKLRPFHALRSLGLNRCRPSVTGYAVLPALTGLRELSLRDTGTNAEEMALVVQCQKLVRLALVTQPFENDGLANIGKLRNLQSLELSELDKLDSKGFAYLADCPALKTVSAGGFVILSGMVANLGHCKSLEYLALPNTFLKDAEVAPLGDLPKLRALDLSNSPVTGAVFSQWRVHKEFASLNLDNAAGINDTICQDLRKVFPQLESLYAKIAPTGFSKAGATALGRLKNLREVRLNGPGVTDEVIDQLAHATNITNLDIPLAQLTDAGAAALGRLSHLTGLSLDMPPITDPALKSFARLKELKTVNIGKDALPDTEYKLQSAVPGVVVHRPED